MNQRTMNVNKININQSEPTYDIASDAYDITYKNSNVGEKLSELENEINGLVTSTPNIFKDGYYVKVADGRRGENSPRAIFSPIAVHQGDKVVVTISEPTTTALAIIAFKTTPSADSDMQCDVESLIAYDGSMQYETTAPFDGYVFVSATKTDAPIVSVGKGYDFKQIEINKQDIEKLNELVKVKKTISHHIEHSWLGINGQINSTGSNSAVCFIHIQRGLYHLRIEKTGNVATVVYGFSKNGTISIPQNPIMGTSEKFESYIEVDGDYDYMIVCYDATYAEPIIEYFSKNDKKVFNLLCVGNSLTQDSFMYVPALLRALVPNFELNLGVGYIGASNLAQHLANILGQTIDGKVVTPYDFECSYDGNAWNNTTKSFDEMIAEKKWDMITFQQMSESSWQTFDLTFAPYIYRIDSAMADKLQNPTRLGFVLNHSAMHQDNAYLEGRWERVAENVKKVKDTTSMVDIFPYGTAIQNLRSVISNLGDYGNLMYDDRHLQEGIGCLCSAYCNALKIIQICGFDMRGIMGDKTAIDTAFIRNNNILGTHPNPITTEKIIGMTESNRHLAIVSAIQAIENPFVLADLSAL